MKRIQRKRTRGWRMPPNAKYVGRPTKWGNPAQIIDVSHELTWSGEKAWRVLSDAGAIVSADFVFTIKEARHDAAEWYRDAYATYAAKHDPNWLTPLRGFDLACWCPLDQPCHADVLIELCSIN